MIDEEYDKIVEAVAKALQNESCRTVLWEVLGMTGLYTVNYDPNLRGHYEGRRSVGLEILQLLERADKKAYINLQLEHLGENDD